MRIPHSDTQNQRDRRRPPEVVQAPSMWRRRRADGAAPPGCAQEAARLKRMQEVEQAAIAKRRADHEAALERRRAEIRERIAAQVQGDKGGKGGGEWLPLASVGWGGSLGHPLMCERGSEPHCMFGRRACGLLSRGGAGALLCLCAGWGASGGLR